MNKELIFNEVVESILGTRTLAVIQRGELINKKGEIWIKTEKQEIYLNYIPYNFKGDNIHGNTRINLAKDFINTYTFDDLKSMYNAKIEAINKHRELEESNKYKLDNLIQELNLNKFKEFTNYNDDVEVRFYNIDGGKYGIEFLINSGNYTDISIYNNDKYNGFTSKIDYKEVEFKEFKSMLEILYLSCKEYKENKEAEARIKREEAKRELEISNAIYKLYKKVNDNIIVLRTGNKNFIAFENGVRYSVGTGKSGKFYRCNWGKFEDIINKKGIEKVSYALLDKDTKTYQENDFYLSLDYENIV